MFVIVRSSSLALVHVCALRPGLWVRAHFHVCARVWFVSLTRMFCLQFNGFIYIALFSLLPFLVSNCAHIVGGST